MSSNVQPISGPSTLDLARPLKAFVDSLQKSLGSCLNKSSRRTKAHNNSNEKKLWTLVIHLLKVFPGGLCGLTRDCTTARRKG